jgi:hypothetical protein
LNLASNDRVGLSCILTEANYSDLGARFWDLLAFRLNCWRDGASCSRASWWLPIASSIYNSRKKIVFQSKPQLFCHTVATSPLFCERGQGPFSFYEMTLGLSPDTMDIKTNMSQARAINSAHHIFLPLLVWRNHRPSQ